MRRAGIGGLTLSAPLVLALAASPRAGAHPIDDPPAAEAPLTEGGALIGAGTNYGLVLREGGRWLWTPEETIEAEVLARHDWLARPGAVFLATSRGLWETTDGGCSWRTIPDLQGRGITALAAGDDLLYAGTEGGAGENGVLVSDDGGASWSATALSGDLQIRALVAADAYVWAAGFDRGAGAHRIWWSDDSGASFREPAGDTSAWRWLRPVDAVGEEVLLLGERAGGEGWALLEADPSLAELEPPCRSDRELVGGAWSAAGEAIGLRATGELSGEALALAPEVSGLGFGCLAPAGGLLWACADVGTSEANLIEVADPPRPRPEIPFSAVEPRSCPEGTPGAERVPELWPVIERLGVGAGSPPPERPAGGGCRAAGGGGPGMVVPLLLALGLASREKA